MSAQVTYVDWLENYAAHPYKMTTIKRYVAMMETAPEKLNISLSKGIMEIADLDEFENLTEKNDFAEKHKEALLASFANVIERMDAFNQWIGERILKTAQALTPAFERLGKMALYIGQEYADSSEFSSVSTDQEE